MYFLLLLFPLISGASIDITPINNENGFTLLQLGNKLIIDYYIKIMHTINLTEYYDVIRTIELNIQSLNLETDTNDYRLLDRELKLARHNLHTIVPYIHTKRQKRGLINILGQGLNFLAGTMDDEDARDIYDHLNNLDQNSRQITEQLNKQVIINDNLMKNVNSVVDNLNKNQVRLNELLNNITDKTNNALNRIGKSSLVFQICTDISTLNRQLEKISDVILMSKLNVLSHDILTEEDKIKYKISVTILPYLKVSVLYQKEKLIFVISTPVFTKDQYINALMIPFPNSQHEELDYEIEQVIIQHENVYQNDNEILKRKLKRHKNDCIRNLFQKDNVCKLKNNNETSIEEINDSLIITKNLPITDIRHDCTQQKLVIRNNNVIQFNDCNIQIGNFVFQNKLQKFSSSVMIPIVNVNFTKLIEK